MPSRAFFQTTPSGGYLNVNPALAKMYGYDSTEELIAGLTAIDNQLYVDSNRRKEFVQAMQEHGMVRRFESEIYRKDKSTIWISENARTVCNDNSRNLLLRGYGRGHHRPQTPRGAVAGSSQENLSALINNIEDAIWSVDADYCLVIFNATFQPVFPGAFLPGPQARRYHGRFPATRMARGRHRSLRPRAWRGKIHLPSGRYEFFRVEQSHEISYNPIRTNEVPAGASPFSARASPERHRANSDLRKAMAAAEAANKMQRANFSPT